MENYEKIVNETKIFTLHIKATILKRIRIIKRDYKNCIL